MGIKHKKDRKGYQIRKQINLNTYDLEEGKLFHHGDLLNKQKIIKNNYF